MVSDAIRSWDVFRLRLRSVFLRPRVDRELDPREASALIERSRALATRLNISE